MCKYQYKNANKILIVMPVIYKNVKPVTEKIETQPYSVYVL